MNKGDLLTQLYERLNYQTTPLTAVTTRLGNFLNEAHRAILREPGMQRLRDIPASMTFASVAAQTYYGLPPVVTDIRAITDRTNDRKLVPLSLRQVREGDPGLDASGTSYGYINFGLRAITMLPATTGLWAVSTSAADTTPLAVQVNGIRTGGNASGDQSGTLTGTSRVAIGTFTDYVDVLSITLSAACAGVITIHDAAASGNTLASIPIGATSQSYIGIQLYPTPTAAITYYVDGPFNALDMDDAQDVPQVLHDFQDLLIHRALMLEYLKQDDDRRFAKASQFYAQGLSHLKHHLSAGPDDLPYLGLSTPVRNSRLGAWTPPGSGY